MSELLEGGQSGGLIVILMEFIDIIIRCMMEFIGLMIECYGEKILHPLNLPYSLRYPHPIKSINFLTQSHQLETFKFLK